MKKLFILFAAAMFVVSCGNNSNSNDTAAGGTTTTDTATGTTDATAPATTTAAAGSDADAEKGLDLIGQSDCLTCHKVEEKLVGPAYREVAQRYAGKPGAVDSLANKIIHGGAGNWGQMAMTPHPALSKADAELMVKYILSIK